MKEIGPYQAPRKQMWFSNALTTIDPRLDYEYLLHTTRDEWNDIFRGFNPTEYYWKYVNFYYWPKLLSMLRKNNS